MRPHLYRDVRIFVEKCDHLVESRLRFGTQRGLVEIIIDILHYLRLVDGRQHEVYAVIGILFGNVRLKFLLDIEITLGAGEHYVFHAPVKVELERAVIARDFLLVGAVIAYYADYGVRYRLVILVYDIARDCYFDFRKQEAVYVVIALGIATVGGEKAGFPLSERDSEIIA